MTKDEALRLALEALEVANSCVDGYYIPKGKTHLPEIELAITAIKEALAQTEQEPVGEIVDAIEGAFKCSFTKMLPVGTKLYTTPPQRTWIGLTEDEVFEISNKMPYADRFDFAEAIEAKLKEKNT
jgi:hypothetical protein